MGILHTADWHLGDRLGRIDRSIDLRRAVERVAVILMRENVDVLLVAGDLFSEMARADSLRETIEHWQAQFREFLATGGTILALTGNHDNENFCRTLHHAMSLAAPLPDEPGTRLPPGRLYLAAVPTLLRLADSKTGRDVQFILMPYPTPSRYLHDDAARRYASNAEKNQVLHDAFVKALNDLRRHASFDHKIPAVLGAHVNVRGAQIGSTLFRINEEDDVLLEAEPLGERFAYVALGHIHRPQALGGMKHVRYCGSIERMDLGERDDAKSIVIVDIGPEGLVGEPQLTGLPSTPIYEVDVRDPTQEMDQIRAHYADCSADLVNLHVTYTAGVDNLEQVLRDLDTIFPRWYSRDWKEAGALGPSLVDPDSSRERNFEESVREYVRQELGNHPEFDSRATC